MKFRELHDLCNSICEYHWEQDGSLLVFVNNYEFEDFMKVLSQYRSLFDDEGINAVLKDHYVCVPEFEKILEYCGMDIDEIKEIFDEP